MYLLLCLLLLVQGSFSHTLQGYQPAVITGLEGDSATLNCTFSYSGEETDWVQGRWHMYRRNGTKQHLSASSKVCVTNRSSTKKITRCVLPITVNFTWIYSNQLLYCEVHKLDVPPEEWTGNGTRILIKALPVISWQGELVSGRETTLTCSSGGSYPEPMTLIWLLNNSTEPTSNSTRISSTRKQDGNLRVSNTFQFIPEVRHHGKVCSCLVFHEKLGEQSRTQKTLDVKYGPHSLRVQYRVFNYTNFTPVGPDGTIHITMGSYLELNCHPDSNPQSRVSWEKNDKGHSEVGQRILVSNSETIRISAFQKEQKETYWCLANNSNGEERIGVQIIVESGFNWMTISFAVRAVLVVSFIAFSCFFINKKPKAHPDSTVISIRKHLRY
ncbi:sialic acid-binding Ig-like lectin 5 [Latimeria chalumnae]|uniref:sialic acid-binding Ig-like lectin 5 n=1 Tax=Latimeria chalumnae TaxID=7897 RepID=UPI00313B29F9